MTQHHPTPQRHTALGRGGEFDMIRELAERWGRAARGLGDDAAILEVPDGEQLVVSTDTSVEDVHFRRRWLTSGEIGYRSAMAALSDLAAMGARPLGMTVALALPRAWTEDFGRLADGIGEAARDVACPVIGGDLSRSDMLHCTFTVLGTTARPVLRSGAKVGDSVYVTGQLGGPGAALRALSAGTEPAPLQRDRFARPVARVREGAWLAERGANAMIDLSDGLVSDADHVASASGVRLTIDLDKLPVMAGSTAVDAARSGEEYELLFTAAAGFDAGAFVRAFRLPLTVIGHVDALAGDHRVAFMSQGKRVDLANGYDHFSR